MGSATIDQERGRPRALIFSQRNIRGGDVWRCPLYEFEDTICQIDSAEILAPKPRERSKLYSKIANNHARVASIFPKPGIPKITLKNSYDILFVVCSFIKDLKDFDVVQNWKDCCRVSICLIDEIWVKSLPGKREYLKILAQFDYVFLYYSQSVKAVSNIIGDKCFFLPPATDAFLFCSYPDPPERFIDVYSYGRRSEVTHQKLLTMAQKNEIFYVYDSILRPEAGNWKEHRFLLANMAKRSRFLIVNPGCVDEPRRGNQSEIGNRYFEGAASGSILIGEYPANPEFEKLFSWPDAAIHLPFGSDQIEKIIRQIDAHPDREEKIHRNNVVHSLRQHDWVYRWETILKRAGIDPLPGLFERKQRLEDLSNIVEKGI